MPSEPHTWPRLFTKELLIEQALIAISPEQSHYLTQVMRRQQNDPIRIFNGLDGEWLASIHETPKSKKKGLILRIDKEYRPQTTDSDISLYAAPIKRAHFDYLVQKCTELGIKTIHPILTDRTQIKEIKLERLNSIAIEAAEQCERLSIPKILDPTPLHEVIRDWEDDKLAIICAEFGRTQPAAEAFSDPIAQISQKTGIFVGPEGGFTSEEMEMFQKMPYSMPIRLGPRILRADTAAIAALTCWQALCGDWKGISE